MDVSYKRIGREIIDAFTLPLREGIASSKSQPSSTEPDSSVPFQYTPLTSPSNFRILHLKQRPGSPAASLYGSLIQASIDAPPEYYALSYAWGDSTLCESLEVDGKRLGITANCAAALRRMIHGKAQRYIWVDSICINQADTTEALEERGRQVAMMDQIYRNAIQVNVHLGAGDAASDAAIVALKGLAKYLLGATVPGPQREFFRRKYESLADDVLASTPEYPYGKLHGLFRLPWFRRLWVLQEVILGRNVMFYCGKHLIHLKTIVFGADFARLPYSKLDEGNRHWMSYLDYHDAMNEFIRRREEGESLPDLRLSGVLLPPAVMHEVTRPEDKIHGLYGVCKRLGFELPVPDYHKPLAVVYTEAARAILRDEPSFELLSCVCESSGWEWGLPSWVPNFSGSFRKWSPSSPPDITFFNKGNTAVSGGSSQWQHEFKLDGQGLAVRGRRLDIVCASGLPWMTDATTTMVGDSPLLTGQCIESFVDCIGSWFEVVQGLDHGGNGYQDDKVAAQLLVRLLAYEGTPHSLNLSAAELESFAGYLSILVARAKFDGDVHQTVLADQQENLRDCLRVGDHQVIPGMTAFLKRIYLNQWKTVFRTVSGYLGVGTHTVQQGDVVAVFHGSPLAAIVRPWEDWFRYIGPAYVNGIMEGEFWSKGSAADDDWFVLV
ncbi:hypothetical protein DL771_004568 [Monosporascus sp. 5C6A]|nr:hypothetical protein DL771_004568 [Monosporascus sp. 5C6A]